MRRSETTTRGAGGALERLRRHRYGTLIEPLQDEPSLLVKAMFGCVACYVHGRLMLVLAARREPWRGLLVPTTRAHQPALQAEVPALKVHPVLRKWLHLRESADDFEAAAAELVRLARADDPRLGVESPPRRSRAAGARRPRPKTGARAGATRRRSRARAF